MSFIKILGTGILGFVCVSILRRFKDDFASPASLFISVTLTASAVGIITPVLDFLRELAGSGGEEYLTLIFKSCGISLITSIGADICRDSGESAIASKLELCGKSTIIMLALPLLKQIFELTYSILKQ